MLLMGHPLHGVVDGQPAVDRRGPRLAPHQNATTLQVAASILGALRWMIDSPTEGLRVPDELPWER